MYDENRTLARMRILWRHQSFVRRRKLIKFRRLRLTKSRRSRKKAEVVPKVE